MASAYSRRAVACGGVLWRAAGAPLSVPTSSLSPFMRTHILEPMHLSMSSVRGIGVRRSRV